MLKMKSVKIAISGYVLDINKYGKMTLRFDMDLEDKLIPLLGKDLWDDSFHLPWKKDTLSISLQKTPAIYREFLGKECRLHVKFRRYEFETQTGELKRGISAYMESVCI